MKKTRFTAFFLAALFALTVLPSNSISAVRVGDPIGNVLHTNVRTYINGHRIPSYNIGGWMVVDTEHLMRYGFDVVFNAAAQTLTITRNPNRAFNPITNFDELAGVPGTVAFNHLHTEIRALINGIPVRSFNVKGYLMVLFEDLRDVGNFGTIVWDSARDELRLTLVNPVSPVIDVTRVTLDRISATIAVGRSIELTAAVVPANATDRSLTWASSNSAVARVDNFGRVTGVAPGTAVITATASNGVSAACTVTVTPAYIPVQSVSLDRTTATVRAAEAVTITASVLPANATDRGLSWTSSNNAVAIVDNFGRVTGISPGTAVITATASNGMSATCTVTVTAAYIPVQSVTLDRIALTMRPAEVVTINATVAPANATDRSLAWTSSNNAVARVDTLGRVTGVSPGTAVITAVASNGIAATCTVTVTQPAIPETHVLINEPNATIRIGEQTVFTANVYPANATDRSVTWTSSHPNIAEVDRYTGRVTGITSPGIATITARTANGLTASRTVTVTPAYVPVTSITVNPTNAAIVVGNTLQIVANVWPSNATTQTVTWISGTPSVATVNPNGLVTALNPGTSVITATSADGLAMAVSVITVNPIGGGDLIPLTVITPTSE